MLKPNEVKLMYNVVRICTAVAGFVTVMSLLALAAIMEG